MKVMAIEIKKLLINFKPYLKYIIINLQKSDLWKIQLTIPINSISLKDTNEE